MIPKYTDPDRRAQDIQPYFLGDYHILPPKLLIGLESMAVQHRHWHLLCGHIVENMHKAREAYIRILPEACIYYAITALEYGLKSKYCLSISESKSDEEADKQLLNLSLGSFLSAGDTKLSELRLASLKSSISALNELRNGLFHFNYERLMAGIKTLGFDFSHWEREGIFVFYTEFVDDTLALNVHNRVKSLLDAIFLGDLGLSATDSSLDKLQ